MANILVLLSTHESHSCNRWVLVIIMMMPSDFSNSGPRFGTRVAFGPIRDLGHQERLHRHLFHLRMKPGGAQEGLQES
jgi:hypothetical protein